MSGRTHLWVTKHGVKSEFGNRRTRAYWLDLQRPLNSKVLGLDPGACACPLFNQLGSTPGFRQGQGAESLQRLAPD